MNNIEKYFLEDRMQLGVGIFISLFGIGIAAYLFFSKNMLYKGMSYGVIPLALLLLSVCVFLFFRTPADMEKAKALYQAGPIKMQTVELPRMEKVLKNFDWIIKTEVSLIIAAIAMLLIFWKNDQLRGIALGITAEAAILVIFDSIETERAKIYIEFLKTL
jgi:hypothetical protein